MSNNPTITQLRAELVKAQAENAVLQEQLELARTTYRAMNATIADLTGRLARARTLFNDIKDRKAQGTTAGKATKAA